MAIAIAASTGAHAAADASTSEITRLANMSLEELLQTPVTSVAGRAESQFATPAAVTVISNDDIRRSGHRTLPEALRLVPGMHVARVNASSWVVGSRGLTGSALTANRYLVLIDGRLVYDPLTSATFWDAVDIPLADVDRIEVVRGPGATLWGVNAMNGVINVITRGAHETTGTLVQIGAGTQGESRALLRHGAALGNQSAVRVWASYTSQDDFENAAGQSIGDAWSSVRAGVRWDSRQASDDAASTTLQAGAYNQPTSNATVRLPVPGAHNSFVMRTSNDTVRGGHMLARVGHAPSVKQGWSVQAYADHSEREGSRFAATRDNAEVEFRSWREWGNGQALIWGASVHSTRDDITSGPALIFEPERRSWTTSNLFVQNTSTLVADTAFLMLGTKITDHEFVGVQVQPSVRAWWTPSPRQTWWAAVSRPVRVPSRFEEDGLLVFAYVDRGLVTTGRADGVFLPLGLAGDRNLAPEKLLSYELGHRIQLSPRVALDTTVFYNDHQRLIGVPPGIFGRFNDDARGVTHGGDVALSARWSDRWRMEASYSLLDTRISGPVLEFDETSTPRHMAQLRSYLDLGNSVELNGAAYYVDEVPFVGVEAYTRLDLGMTWRPHPQAEVSLWGQNLLDSGHSEGSGAQVPRGIYAQATVYLGE